MNKADELVLCIKPDMQFFKPSNKILNMNYEFVRRGECETDPTYKQLIPYVILYDYVDDLTVYYTRKTGDKRLTSKSSIGLGGHINPEDEDLYLEATILNNIHRELCEEVGSNLPITMDGISRRGFIYDDSDEVGRVHTGIIYILPMNLSVAKNWEDNEHSFEIVAVENIDTDNLENWSKIVYNNIFRYPKQVCAEFVSATSEE